MAKLRYYRITFLLFILISLFFYLFFYDFISRVDTKERVVFLTFDDGPSENIFEILRILDEKNVSATFFLVGDNVLGYPYVVDLINYSNHSIGIHSMSHLYYNVSNELLLSKNLLEDKFARDVYLFRPPYGFISPFLMLKSKSLNLTIVRWDVFPRDYKRNSSEIIFEIDGEFKSGSIIVLHDGGGNRSETIDALPFIIDMIREEGFEFALLEDYI